MIICRTLHLLLAAGPYCILVTLSQGDECTYMYHNNVKNADEDVTYCREKDCVDECRCR